MAACERLRNRFENQEAIYVEKGALRVRVGQIRLEPDQRWISAEVEEIPTVGLGVGIFPEWQDTEQGRQRWKIGAGYLTSFSQNVWYMGHGGWQMYFAPRIVQGVVDLASRFNQGTGPFERYNQVFRYICAHDRPERAQRVFGSP